MHGVVVSGIGWVTCLGREPAEIENRLRTLSHGIVRYPPLADDARVPVSVAAPVPGFETASDDPEDWTYPEGIRLRLEQKRALAPHGLYALFAFEDALRAAGLSLEDVAEDPRSGLFTASSGSAKMTHFHIDRMERVGPMRCSPLGIVASIAGTLNFNLVARYKIQGATAGFVSACASSGHALGYAFDEIALGRQDRVIVVGAEDFTRQTLVPFSTMRVLSKSEDPARASRPFDRDRDGFVGTGGAVALVLENAQTAAARGASVLAQFRGWGQSTDGHHVAIAHPSGAGLERAMRHALESSGVAAREIDYVNAHATGTVPGDVAEARALRRVFDEGERGPWVSSTKGLTGHALSLASAMEAGFSILALQGGFVPGQAGLETPDPEAETLRLPRETVETPLRHVLSNSSGFGGANVSLVFSSPAGGHG